MKLFVSIMIVWVAIGCASSTTHPAPSAGPIKWEEFSDDVFARAKRENKFVLMDLHAVWCHWCHVMDETTYKDPRVRQLIAEKYIAVGVDQDSRPDLSNRYEDYGWPATIVFNAHGGEIAKRRGYLTSDQMSSMLAEIILDPTPGPSIQAEQKLTTADTASLPPELKQDLQTRITETYDEKNGAWGTVQKFLNWDNVEYCLVNAASGDEASKKMARQTLTAQLHLLDPVWGGVYQYSTDGDWEHPHFEKIMQMQAENLRIYSQAYALWHDPADLASAQKIHAYLKNFFTSPDGAFYVSQDADLVAGEHSAEYFALDDAGRRKKGIPRVDTHIYSRENGWAICALVELYCASGDETALAEAERATKWIQDHRSTDNGASGGAFRHDETDAKGPYLGDTLAMGRAFLALYTATANRDWLTRATQCADLLDTKFRDTIGFGTAARGSSPLRPILQFDENIAVARFTNLLFHHTGDACHRAMAEHAMKYLATPQVAQTRGFGVGGLLLADRELSAEPPHIAIVGPRDDARTQSLYRAAISYFDQFKRIDLVAPGEPPLPKTDVTYPELSNPAAFLCTNGACSAPISDPARLLTKMQSRIAAK